MCEKQGASWLYWNLATKPPHALCEVAFETYADIQTSRTNFAERQNANQVTTLLW